METPVKAVSYLRVSGGGQLSGDGFTRQSAACVLCAAQHDYEIVAEYYEEAVPGKTDMDGRPAFQEMVASLLSNGCRVIIVEGLDRLAREYRIQEQLIIYLASKGLTLISANTGENVTEAMMGDPMRRFLVQLQGLLAEMDKNMIVAKLSKARQRKRTNEGRCEGRKRYGERDGEREVVATIVAKHREGLFNAGGIAHMLNVDNIPTRYGRKWTATQVKRILNRERGKQ